MGRLGPDTADCGAVEVLGLASDLGLSPRGSWGWCHLWAKPSSNTPGCRTLESWVIAGVLLCGTRPWALWWRGGLKTAGCQWVAGPSFLLGLRHLSTGADRLVSGARIALVSYREDSKMALASTSVLLGGRAYKYVCCQCFCPQGELQLLLPLQEVLQDQQIGLTHAPFKLLLLPQVLVCVRFCMSFLRVEGPHYISTV